MSTGILYHGLGVRGYVHESVHYVGGEIVFWIRQEPESWRCSACGSADVAGRGREVRRFRCVSLGRKRISLVLPVPRLECQRCGVVRQAAIPFARPRCTYTKSFETYVLELCRLMTMLDVARHFGVSWHLVKEIQARDLEKRFAKPKLKKLRQIAIDEISIGKGHRYLTVVLDLETGRVVYVGEGKGADALKSFWKRLYASHARVKAVAIDMSQAYIAAVKKHLPNAALVFDRFHIVKLFNDKLSDLRRELHREASGLLEKKVLKGTRWLLLKNPENLDDRRNEKQRLADALRLNEPLATAYYMKEDLRQFWEQPTKATARRVLADWVARAQASGIRILQGLAKTVAAYREGILAWYDFPISTGPLEGTNNKIQTMKRQAYGFRNIEFFKLKILAVHESKWALVG
jgi:transposase